MGRLLQIAQLGHEVLRQQAALVADVHDPLIQSLIDDMLATVAEARGVGLAAPQVYESRSIIVIASHANPRYPQAPDMEPIAMLNPEILSVSHEIEKDWEGCLSIPGIRGLVPRHRSLEMAYTTREGDHVKKSFSDFVARIIQHEVDHLRGIFFLDRMERTEEIVAEKEYLRIVEAQRSSTG